MKLIEISLYDLHKDPKSLYGYDKADMEVPDVFWDKYRANPKELKKREDAIAKDTYYAYEYAVNVLGNVWPKGEDAIAKDPRLACRYARFVIDGRFPKGEKTIMRDPFCAFTYAKYVLKRQWPEAEKYIAKDREWKEAYEKMFRVNI